MTLRPITFFFNSLLRDRKRYKLSKATRYYSPYYMLGVEKTFHLFLNGLYKYHTDTYTWLNVSVMFYTARKYSISTRNVITRLTRAAHTDELLFSASRLKIQLRVKQAYYAQRLFGTKKIVGLETIQNRVEHISAKISGLLKSKNSGESARAPANKKYMYRSLSRVRYVGCTPKAHPFSWTGWHLQRSPLYQAIPNI
jgi:hypothetical protein